MKFSKDIPNPLQLNKLVLFDGIDIIIFLCQWVLYYYQS